MSSDKNSINTIIPADGKTVKALILPKLFKKKRKHFARHAAQKEAEIFFSLKDLQKTERHDD